MSQTTLGEPRLNLLKEPLKEEKAPIRRATATFRQLTTETLKGVLTIKVLTKS